jgi:hypothetical protein
MEMRKGGIRHKVSIIDQGTLNIRRKRRRNKEEEMKFTWNYIVRTLTPCIQ